MHEWEMCGLVIENGAAVDLAALESYISLPTSSAIDMITIDPKSILIIRMNFLERILTMKTAHENDQD